MGCRIATFSFRKALGVPFQSIWDDALDLLTKAGLWLFVGYSLPDADIEIRHLLKTAELARPIRPSIEVVLRCDHAASGRYRSFFGLAQNPFMHGLSAWMAHGLPDSIRVGRVRQERASALNESRAAVITDLE